MSERAPSFARARQRQSVWCGARCTRLLTVGCLIYVFDATELLLCRHRADVCTPDRFSFRQEWKIIYYCRHCRCDDQIMVDFFVFLFRPRSSRICFAPNCSISISFPTRNREQRKQCMQRHLWSCFFVVVWISLVEWLAKTLRINIMLRCESKQFICTNDGLNRNTRIEIQIVIGNVINARKKSSKSVACAIQMQRNHQYNSVVAQNGEK